jgi:hypothetical protein
MPGFSSYGEAVRAAGAAVPAGGGFDFGGLIRDLAPALGGALGGKGRGTQQKVTSSQSQALSQNIGVSPQFIVQVGSPALGDPFTGSATGGGAAAPSAATANDTQPRLAVPQNTYGRASISTPYAYGALNGVTTPGFEGGLADLASNPLVLAGIVAAGAFLLFGMKKGKK